MTEQFCPPNAAVTNLLLYLSVGVYGRVLLELVFLYLYLFNSGFVPKMFFRILD